MNKKIVSSLLAATLLAGGTSVFAQTADATAKPQKQESTTKKTGLENALEHVKNETARQHIMDNIEKQWKATTGDSVTVTTGDSVTVTPGKEDKPKEEAKKPSVIVIKINGKIMITNQKPIIINNRTVVPLRSIFEALGAEIKWDAKKQTVYATKGNRKVMIKIGDQNAVVNGKKVKLNQKATIVNNRTMVPLRFVSEALGASVEWDAKNATVHIKTTIKTN
ncbi:Copper amine oxidase N-terminal domain-containing protein [Aneurinibacillus thermoaerophilus]|uniref:Copper amine oxidase N-terminal domain-containing protein n=1 Tax=Aneurinibacillus thermoaerophilus TaxID=143495 RepID=A0A1G7Z7E0_ANETH|nr:copper amine oxidase N-terminal domain-containing protein [Aneurinibacillus thermoaerophilus]MED0674807.1 copper amine oxidase N-terminal domain-containing protein [Aneurinibacillus thermoaerophilus]MED0679757.1 copper amine oxidase N-terminal domain-containing protein [Aneurinibacillus thermoaerophilus]MED0763987.1 copper amine oxidase N-terminal domain-containing protein [Aneurinibacillus thermoaerophilus]SDH04030.1 Copper amine oxidase N-terminal domain-containing protein [Aneurinibacillu